MDIRLHDKLTLDASTTRRTDDGYLVTSARVARTGIQLYRGREIDPDNIHGLRDREVVRVYRPGEQVFDVESMKSFAHRPITNDHPSEPVTADNWKRLAVGQIGSEIARDGDFIRVPMILMDSAMIRDVDAGKRELSMGYTASLKFGDGVSPDGQAFDAIQTSLRMNHLAVVSVARGGSDLKIGDANQIEDKATMPNRTILVDGLPVELADRDATIVERTMQKEAKRLSDTETALAAATDAHTKAMAAKDAELAKKDAEIADLKSKVTDAAAIDKLVAGRAALIATAKSIVADLVTDGKSDAEIRKAVVEAKRGADTIKDKSAAYIDAAFDLIAEGTKSSDPVRDALKSGNVTVSVGDAAAVEAAALAKSVANLNSWRDKKAGA